MPKKDAEPIEALSMPSVSVPPEAELTVTLHGKSITIPAGAVIVCNGGRQARGRLQEWLDYVSQEILKTPAETEKALMAGTDLPGTTNPVRYSVVDGVHRFDNG